MSITTTTTAEALETVGYEYFLKKSIPKHFLVLATSSCCHGVLAIVMNSKETYFPVCVLNL